jgi:hypothetical protein
MKRTIWAQVSGLVLLIGGTCLGQAAPPDGPPDRGRAGPPMQRQFDQRRGIRDDRPDDPPYRRRGWVREDQRGPRMRARDYRRHLRRREMARRAFDRFGPPEGRDFAPGDGRGFGPPEGPGFGPPRRHRFGPPPPPPPGRWESQGARGRDFGPPRHRFGPPDERQLERSDQGFNPRFDDNSRPRGPRGFEQSDRDLGPAEGRFGPPGGRRFDEPERDPGPPPAGRLRPPEGSSDDRGPGLGQDRRSRPAAPLDAAPRGGRRAAPRDEAGAGADAPPRAPRPEPRQGADRRDDDSPPAPPQRPRRPTPSDDSPGDQ